MNNKLLIIDDDRRVCELLHTIAAGSGFDVFVLDNPELFEQSFIGYQPDIILLDLNMKQKDGIELLRFLSLQDRTPGVIIVSGENESIIQASLLLANSFKLNLLGVFRKPFDIHLVRQQLRKCFNTGRTDIPVPITRLAGLIKKENLQLCFQPRVSLETGAVEGIETLLRLKTDCGELAYPDSFFRYLNQPQNEALAYTVFELSLNNFMLLSNCTEQLDVYINLPAVLLVDLDLPEKLLAITERYDINPHNIVLEIPDLATVSRSINLIDVMARLRLKRFRLSTSYVNSKIIALIVRNKLPITDIKIDRDSLLTRKIDALALQKLAKSVKAYSDMKVNLVAMKVESETEVRLFKKMGFSSVQGNYIGRDLSMTGINAWLEDWQTVHLNTNNEKTNFYQEKKCASNASA